MVEAVLNVELPQAPFRITAVKFVGGVLAIGWGLALSREGPSVQSPDRGEHRAGLFFGQLCQLVFPRGLWRTPPVPSGEAQFQNWRVSKVPCDHRIDGGDDCLSVLTPSQISALVEPLDRVFIEHASKQSAHNSPRVVQVAAIQEPAPDCVLYGSLVGAYTGWLSGSGVALDPKGFVLTGADVGESRRSLETSRHGVYAIGDIRSGSIKRVAAAVGEGAQVARSCTLICRRRMLFRQ